jgi:8-oxo-dGTP diphosphatase
VEAGKSNKGKTQRGMVRMVNPVIHVTAGIIIKCDNVLLAKRGRFTAMSGLWEFPGGKIERGETPAECLKRELEEELQIRVELSSITPFDFSFYEYGSKRVFLIGMMAGRYSGVIDPVEHAEIRWVGIDALDTIALAPADVPIARRLERYYSTTGKRILRLMKRSNTSAGTGPLK